MSEIFIPLGIGMAVFIAIFLVMSTISQNKRKGIESRLEKIEGFTPSQNLIGATAESGISIDEVKEQICLITKENDDYSFKVMTYKDLLAVEVYEDGSSVTSTSRGSQVGGALIGGLALGGVGAIIGGLSAKQTTTQKVSRIELRIVVNDTKSPILDILIVHMPDMERHSGFYKENMGLARHWNGLISVLIKQADEIDQKEEVPMQKEKIRTISNQSTPVSSNTKIDKLLITKEIVRLGGLRKMKVLTEQEFKERKTFLMELKDEMPKSGIEVASDILDLAKMYKNKLLTKDEFISQKESLLSFNTVLLMQPAALK